MRFCARSELHFVFPFTLVIDSRPTMSRARENGLIGECEVIRGGLTILPDARAWMIDRFGAKGGTWDVVFSGASATFVFARRRDAMHFKLVWG
jgi:hypothetical protein